MWFLLVGLLLNSLLPSPALVSNSSLALFPDTPKGFDLQYHEFFNSYKGGDERSIALELDKFAIPSHWFTDAFGVDNGTEVAKLYSQEFEYFKFSTILKFRKQYRIASVRTSQVKLQNKRDHVVKCDF